MTSSKGSLQQPVPGLPRRQFLLFSLASLCGGKTLAQSTHDSCPLNSGGPSLLGTRWRLVSLYNNRIPSELEITMKVGEEDMKGMGGCNRYQANFQQVGNRGFKVVNIQQSKKPCERIKTKPGSRTINVGSWEGSYLRTLRRAGSVEQKGLTLQFYDFNGKPSVVFTKQFGA